VRRAALALAVTGAFAATADLAHKAATEPQYLHARSAGYVVFVLVLGAAWALAIVATRSVPLALGGGVLTGGIVGNVASLALWPGVPNPIVVEPIAFNLADLFVVGGFVLVGLATLWLLATQPERLREQVGI
jgi:hypothetical protein